MSDIDMLKAEIRKLSGAAIQAKMDLHDLSEELPVNWERIPSVAEACHGAFRTLEAKRCELKALTAGTPCPQP
jgi:hypothetical protein